VPLNHGSVVRLRHQPTGRWLHSRAGVPSPISHQQQVSAVDDGSSDTWRVELERPGPWLAGARVRVVHVPSGTFLHSHHGSDPTFTTGQQETSTVAVRDPDTFWTVLELS
jgi:dolichyl-phosphate-mannose--protein O-mannosyl transferase